MILDAIFFKMTRSKEILLKLNKITNENILDDILSDFSDINTDNDLLISSKDIKDFKPKVKTLKHKVIKPKKVIATDRDFKEYLRSESEVKRELKNASLDFSVKSICELYGAKKLAIADSVILEFDVKDVYNYREYDWTRSSARWGSEKWDELKDSIKKNGIKQYGVLSLYRDKKGNVEVFIGEGNHRITLAKEVGIRKIPMRVSYS